MARSGTSAKRESSPWARWPHARSSWVTAGGDGCSSCGTRVPQPTGSCIQLCDLSHGGYRGSTGTRATRGPVRPAKERSNITLLTIPFVQHPSLDQHIVTAIERPEPIRPLQKAIGSWLARAPLPINLRVIGHCLADDEPIIRHAVQPSDPLVPGELRLPKADVAGVARIIRIGGRPKAVEVAVQEPPPAAAIIAVYSLDPPNLLLTPDLHIDTEDGGMLTLLCKTLNSEEAGRLEVAREVFRLTITFYNDHDTTAEATYCLNVITTDVG